MAKPKTTRICEECGKVFWPRGSRSRFCDGPHYRKCVICGKEAEVPFDKLSSKHAFTCSKECLNKARGQLAVKSAEADPKYKCKCSVCGKIFLATHPGQRICNDRHTIKCAYCGKEFEPTRQQLISNTQTCSEQCRRKLSVQTYQQHYSIENNHEAHEELIARMQQTTFERHGYKNALSNEGRELSGAAQAFRDKYGADRPGEVPELVAKARQTSLERYGNICPLVNPEIAEKSRKTLMEKYGVDNYAKSNSFLKQTIAYPEKSEYWMKFKDDPEKFVTQHFSENKPTLDQIARLCGVRDSSIKYVLDQHEGLDIVSYTYSRMEDEVYEILIDLLGEGSNIQRNTFQVITPYELDLYLPDYNFAIECNPTVTHNSTLPGWSSNDEPKAASYHKMKTDRCEEKGIFLFHIFGYEWSHRKDIIVSMIRNILNCNESKLHARKLTVKEVSDNDSMKFLNENHRQGGAHSSIRLGLYNNDELVSLMTFSKMRKTIGTGKTNLDNCFELVRFCNKINTSVVGGASKLFKHFLKMVNPEEVRSFSDRSHTQGGLYETLGFAYDHTSDPGYMWVNLKTDQGFARSNAQKSNIKKFLKDEGIDLSKTEVQIMQEHGYVQVFDSGVKLWIWRKESNI